MSFVALKDLTQREIAPGLRAKFIHSENMTIAYWDIDAGADLPAHSHMHEQVTNILEGKFELTVGDDTKVMNAGTIAIIPPNVLHSGKALTACRVIDIFHPLREDYKKPVTTSPFVVAGGKASE